MVIKEVRITGDLAGLDLAAAYRMGCYVVGLHQSGAASAQGICNGDRLVSVSDGNHHIPMLHSTLNEVQRILIEAVRPFTITFYRPSVPDIDDNNLGDFIYRFLNCSVRERAFRSSNYYINQRNDVKSIINCYKVVKQVESVIGRDRLLTTLNSGATVLSKVLDHLDDFPDELRPHNWHDVNINSFFDNIQSRIHAIIRAWSLSEEGAKCFGYFSLLDIVVCNDSLLLDRVYFLYELNTKSYRDIYESMISSARRVLDLCTATNRSLGSILRGTDSHDRIDQFRQALFIYFQYQYDKGAIKENPLLSITFDNTDCTTTGDNLGFLVVNGKTRDCSCINTDSSPGLNPANKADYDDKLLRIIRLAVEYPTPGRLEYCYRQTLHMCSRATTDGITSVFSVNDSNFGAATFSSLRLHLPPRYQEHLQPQLCVDQSSYQMDSPKASTLNAKLLFECLNAKHFAQSFLMLLLEEQLIVVDSYQPQALNTSLNSKHFRGGQDEHEDTEAKARETRDIKTAAGTIVDFLQKALLGGGYLRWHHSVLNDADISEQCSLSSSRTYSANLLIAQTSHQSRVAYQLSHNDDNDPLRTFTPEDHSRQPAVHLHERIFNELWKSAPFSSIQWPSIEGVSATMPQQLKVVRDSLGNVQAHTREAFALSNDIENSVDGSIVDNKDAADDDCYLSGDLSDEDEDIHALLQMPFPYIAIVHQPLYADVHRSTTFSAFLARLRKGLPTTWIWDLEHQRIEPPTRGHIEVPSRIHGALSHSLDCIMRPNYRQSCALPNDDNDSKKMSRLIDCCTSLIRTLVSLVDECSFGAGEVTFFDESRYIDKTTDLLQLSFPLGINERDCTKSYTGVKSKKCGDDDDDDDDGDKGILKAFLERFVSTQHFSVYLTRKTIAKS